MEPTTAAIERVLKRDRVIVTAGLSLVAAASLLYILAGAGMDMAGGMMSAPADWSAGYALLMFFMWWIMMVAMMVPSAAPMILLFAAVHRKSAGSANPNIPTLIFTSGYLAVWGGFSVAAVALQWFLTSVHLLSPMLEGTSLVLGGLLLVAAGIYQLTPLKEACLRHCRSPMHIVMSRWRPGTLGAIRMGCEHGVFCLGCCWVLMGLLFYGGVMNLAWIGGLAVYVLIEKLAPMGDKIGRYAGGLLIVWGAAVLWLATPG
jgi:predicted metal-binding membrane protein